MFSKTVLFPLGFLQITVQVKTDHFLIFISAVRAGSHSASARGGSQIIVSFPGCFCTSRLGAHNMIGQFQAIYHF